MIANWLVKEPELIIMSRPCTTKIIISLLKAVSSNAMKSDIAWKLHFVMIESFQHRKLTSMGVKRPTVPSYMERVSADNLPPLLRLRYDLFKVYTKITPIMGKVTATKHYIKWSLIVVT